MAVEKRSPRYGKNKGRKINSRWRETFIDTLAQTSNVTRSARAAKVEPSQVYRTRREEPLFYEKWQQALCEGYDHLELEILRRLREGDMLASDGNRYDFGSALRILTAHRESVARIRAQRSNTSVAEVRASIDRKVEEVRQSVLAREAQQAATARDG